MVSNNSQNKVNYDRVMEDTISKFTANGKKPKVLLHSCCAPCSSACLERLMEICDVTVYFYNPNMDSEQEYNHRLDEQKRLCATLGVECIFEEYNADEFYGAVRGLENAPEGGIRCERCFWIRLSKSAEKAKAGGYDFFTTTLTVSPLKNSELINEVGKRAEKETGVKFLNSDFKKRNGYLRSIELSKKYVLYRQNYCGCKFSRREDN